jgi:hypothetical protein
VLQAQTAGCGYDTAKVMCACNADDTLADALRIQQATGTALPCTDVHLSVRKCVAEVGVQMASHDGGPISHAALVRHRQSHAGRRQRPEIGPQPTTLHKRLQEASGRRSANSLIVHVNVQRCGRWLLLAGAARVKITERAIGASVNVS